MPISHSGYTLGFLLKVFFEEEVEKVLVSSLAKLLKANSNTLTAVISTKSALSYYYYHIFLNVSFSSNYRVHKLSAKTYDFNV